MHFLPVVVYQQVDDESVFVLVIYVSQHRQLVSSHCHAYIPRIEYRRCLCGIIKKVNVHHRPFSL